MDTLLNDKSLDIRAMFACLVYRYIFEKKYP